MAAGLASTGHTPQSTGRCIAGRACASPRSGNLPVALRLFRSGGDLAVLRGHRFGSTLSITCVRRQACALTQAAQRNPSLPPPANDPNYPTAWISEIRRATLAAGRWLGSIAIAVCGRLDRRKVWTCSLTHWACEATRRFKLRVMVLVRSLHGSVIRRARPASIRWWSSAVTSRTWWLTSLE